MFFNRRNYYYRDYPVPYYNSAPMAAHGSKNAAELTRTVSVSTD